MYDYYHPYDYYRPYDYRYYRRHRYYDCCYRPWYYGSYPYMPYSYYPGWPY